jgi:diguanylate cyclase (GGDEF)-like protein
MAAAAASVSSYVHPEEKLAQLKNVERKQLWQWICELGVTVLGLTTYVLLSFPGFTQHVEPLYRVEPAAAFPGLTALLLLFMTLSLRERWLLRQERNGLLGLQGPVQGDEKAEMLTETAAVAAVDPVTELPNGPAAAEWLKKEMAAARNRKKPLTLLMLRVEDWDRVYRGGGNELCEAALRLAGERMRSATRGSDLAAHLGNGEFVLALTGCSLPESQRVLGRVGQLEVRHGSKQEHLEFASASVDLQAGESPAEFIQRGRMLLRLYADAGTKAGASQIITVN